MIMYSHVIFGQNTEHDTERDTDTGRTLRSEKFDHVTPQNT